jgi:hypothetical protein
MGLWKMKISMEENVKFGSLEKRYCNIFMYSRLHGSFSSFFCYLTFIRFGCFIYLFEIG